MRFYQQLPLPSERPCFRLIEIDLGGDQEDPVRGTAAVYDLNDPCDIEYDALSYCWGAPDTTEHIILNDEEIPASKNLVAALRQVRADQRAAGAGKKLWVDAVCINQRDNAEKSHQVMLMRNIYTSAQHVLSWIGEPDELSPLAFDTLLRFAADDGTPDGSNTYRDLQDDRLEQRRAAVQRFVQRQYFFRMWIVQEVVAAKKATVFCGPDSIDFDSTCLALQRVTGSGLYPFSQETANLTYVKHWRDAFHNNVPGPGGEEELDLRLFLDTRDRSATDPRDKIYSLRGIARERIAAGIRVDYGLPVRQVYTDFSRHILKVRPDLQVLSSVMLRHNATSVLGLPSYVPDWTQPKYGGGFLQRYYRFKPTHLFRAAAGTAPEVTVAEDGVDGVSLAGLRLDTIARVITKGQLLARAGGDSSGRLALTEAMLRSLALDIFAPAASASPDTISTYAPTGEPAWTACFRTLTADRTALSPRISDNYRTVYFAAFAAFDGQQSGDDDGIVPANLPGAMWDEISNQVETIVEDKDLFVTDRGYLGLGHEGCTPGDTVCIFAGGEVPFLVRPHPGGAEKAFQFLGECYVHGVMDGEAWDETAPLEQFLLL